MLLAGSLWALAAYDKERRTYFEDIRNRLR
jgi:hypothetical protein